MPKMEKGQRFGGRQKGTPNKTTQALKDAILEAGQLAGDELEPNGGLVAYLKNIAGKKPDLFCSLLEKVLPHTIVGDAQNPLIVEHKAADAFNEVAASLESLGRTKTGSDPRPN